MNNGREKLTGKLHFLEDFYSRVSGENQKGFTAREIYRKLKMKEQGHIHILSIGLLSKMNMDNFVIKDFERQN